VTDRRWTVSNLLSGLRIILAAPIVIAMTSEGVPAWLLPALVATAIASDFFDGFIARRLHEESNLGRILDPIADKILIGAVALTLTAQGKFPLWLLSAIIARDLLILAGGWWLMRRGSGAPPASNLPGKTAAAVMAGALAVALFGGADWWLFTLCAALTAGAIVVSLVIYAAAFRKAANRQ
jgi:CDP-diacylglycerol--glycerol-3-phosphate 3-phosphatidyltransferase